VFIVVIGVGGHYLAGVEWPLAVGIGAAASIVLRRLIHGEAARRIFGNRAVTGR
jgi:hypothetical protein